MTRADARYALRDFCEDILADAATLAGTGFAEDRFREIGPARWRRSGQRHRRLEDPSSMLIPPAISAPDRRTGLV